MKINVTGRPLIMGILNITPNSFSDGGEYHDMDSALKQALRMVEEGADIIDIGGESTRPGAERINAGEQIKRVIPVLENLKKLVPEYIKISIDTTLSEVASTALKSGADIINDISAGRDDPDMMKLVARYGCSYLIMHMQGNPATMQDNPTYQNVVEEIRNFLLDRVELAKSAGIKHENIIIDPGIGFGKTKEHNLNLIANLYRFVDTGYPVCLGTSRKRFMGSICENTNSEQLTGATCATTVIGVNAGIKLFRVHDVLENRQAVEIAYAINNYINT